MTERNLSIRLSVEDADKVRAALAAVGKDGADALRRFEQASAPASRGLLAIDAASRELRNRFDEFANRVPVVGGALRALGPVGTAVGATLVGVGLAMRPAIEAAAEYEQTVARLNAVQRAAGGASGLLAAEIADLADELERTTTADDIGVLRAASQLSTFGSIAGENFKRAVALGQDLAAVFGTDIQNAVLQVGKALDDPEQGLTALRRAGVTFNDTQRDLIRNLVESGDKARAQTLILDALEKKVGGAGAAERTGVAGAAKGLADAWDDLLKSLGRTPAVRDTAVATIGALKDATRGVEAAVREKKPSERISRLEQQRADALLNIEEARKAGLPDSDPQIANSLKFLTATAPELDLQRSLSLVDEIIDGQARLALASAATKAQVDENTDAAMRLARSFDPVGEAAQKLKGQQELLSKAIAATTEQIAAQAAAGDLAGAEATAERLRRLRDAEEQVGAAQKTNLTIGQQAKKAADDEARVLAAAPAQRALVRAAIEAENEARRLGLDAKGKELERAQFIAGRLDQARGREADAAKQALAEIELETQGLAALAAAYGESEEAALRQIAANQAAAQAAKNGAVDQAALRDAILRRDAAHLAEGSGRCIADRARDVAGLEAVASAEASGGPAAAAEIERQNKVAAEAAKLRTAANAAGSDAIREKLFAEIAALEQLSKSEADAARERQSAQVLNARREELELLQAELALQDVSDGERGRRLELLRVELDLKRRGIELTSDQARKEIDLAGRIGETRGELQRIADQRESMRDLTRVISTGFEDAVVRGKSLREVLKGVAEDLARIAFRVSVTKPLENALTGSGGGSDLLSGALGFLGGLFGGGAPSVGGLASNSASLANAGFAFNAPFAKGGAFDRGSLVPFARGGVVRRPTVFPFESGVGLMGEAGPEAIMPLRRLPSGRLGVEAANNGSRTVVINQTVNITVQGGGQGAPGGGQGAPGGGLDPETIRRLGATLRRETEAAVDRRIQELLRPGNALNSSF